MAKIVIKRRPGTRFITRAEARRRGLIKFFVGNVCPHGHVAERYTKNGNCVACQCGPVHDKSRQRRFRKPAYRAAYLARQRRWRRNNADKVLKQKIRETERRGRVAELLAALKTRMPELLEEFGL